MITHANHMQRFEELKQFYRTEIAKAAEDRGYRELSRTLGHQDNFINVVLRRDAFSALQRLYMDIYN